MINGSVLQLKNISKIYPGVRALNDVSFEAKSGEILGLLGVNGAGKSTMMNVIGGLIQPDEGNILINHEKVEITNPEKAKELGIAFIQQEIQIFDNLMIYENVFITELNDYYVSKHIPFVKHSELIKQAKKYLDMLGLQIPVTTKMSRLSVGEQQMVQIARALSQGGRIILFDEPTSSLTGKEKEILFKTIRKLKDSGYIIIYITHYLEEVYDICDRIVVLKDGELAGSEVLEGLPRDKIVHMMLGKEISQVANEDRKIAAEKVLEVNNLSGKKLPKNVSFHLSKGEILGIWGLMGSGRTEMIRTILGLDKKKNGEIRINVNGSMKKVSGRELFKYTSYLTESRHFDGLFPKMPLWKNITVSSLDRYSTKYLKILNEKSEKEAALEEIEKINVKTADENVLARNLSGGNQQKMIMARWFLKNTDILFLDEPTKGVDVGSKVEIQNIIFEKARTGKSFIIISSEMDEIMALCDRIIVLRKGEQVTELTKEQFSKTNLMKDIVNGGR